MSRWETEASIESEVYRLPIQIVVARLVGLAGVVVTGTIGNVKNERSVRQWVTGDCRPDCEQQLRFALRIATMIAVTCGPLVVQSWFKGSNSALGDHAPAIVLRDDFSEETRKAMLGAVRWLGQ